MQVYTLSEMRRQKIEAKKLFSSPDAKRAGWTLERCLEFVREVDREADRRRSELFHRAALEIEEEEKK